MLLKTCFFSLLMVVSFITYSEEEFSHIFSNDIYRVRPYGLGGGYCSYPWPHINQFGNCPYYLPYWNMQFNLNPEKNKNARQRYLDQLFHQAFLGQMEAQFILGYRYQRDDMGVQKDLSRSYAWLNLAIQNKHQSAQYWMDKIINEMTAHELEEGQKRTNNLKEEIIKNISERNQYLREHVFIDYPDFERK